MNKKTELRIMLDGVDQLATAMKKKLREKAREGYHGGLDPASQYDVVKMLQEHVERLTGLCPHCKAIDGDHDREEGTRQAIDVCNLALMIWLVNRARTART